MFDAKVIYKFMISHRMLIFLSCLVLLLVAFPFIHESFPDYLIIIELLFTILLIAGIFLVSHNQQILFVSIILATLASTVMWFNFVIYSPTLLLFGLFLEICFYSLTTFVIITHVLEFDRVTSDKIHGAVSAYLLLTVIWAMTYTALELANPHSFNFAHGLQHSSSSVAGYRFYLGEFLYFSFVTITTLGYGDITPMSNAARGLTSLEAVTGQIYIAVLIARLVGLHITHTHWQQMQEENGKTKKTRKKKPSP